MCSSNEDYWEILHWNYRNLENFPEELKENGEKVYDLYLKGNYIQNLPKWVKQLENLTELHLSENRLEELPEIISNLKFLTVLDVDDNKIRFLPKSITSLIRLQRLNVSRNLLTSIPNDIGKLKSLWCLYVNENNLLRIPDSVVDCETLRNIQLAQNKVTSLPKAMVNMIHLQEISVDDNSLLYLPAIPFLYQPYLLSSRSNEHLNYLSCNVFHGMKGRATWRSVLHQYGFSKKKIKGKTQVPIPESCSTIRAENHEIFVIPMNRVNHGDSKTAAPLRDICMRTMHNLCYTYSDFRRLENNPSYHTLIPNFIGKELRDGPTSYCHTCDSSLFKYCFLRVLVPQNDWHTPNIEFHIIQYFCSEQCVKLFKNECLAKNFTELRWTHEMQKVLV